VLHATSRESRADLRLPRALVPFSADRGADMRLEVCASPVPSPAAGSVLFDSGGLWRVHAQGALRLYVFHEDPTRPPARGALVSPDWREGTLFVPHSAERGSRFALDYPLDEIAFRDHLAHDGALLLHASAVIVDAGAVLFIGHSGAGKSTTAALWRRHARGARVLSDDRVVVRPVRGRPWAWGTPWHGSGRWASPERAPVAAVCVLEQAGSTSLEPIGSPLAAAEVLARAFPPIWDAFALGRALDTAAAVAAAVPVMRLRFRPEAGAVRAVLRFLAG
jgi:hypothetical protein